MFALEAIFRHAYLLVFLLVLQNNLKNMLNVVFSFKKETTKNFMNFAEFRVIFEFEAIFNLVSTKVNV